MTSNPYVRLVTAIAAAAAVVLQAVYPGVQWARVVTMAIAAAVGVLQGGAAVGQLADTAAVKFVQRVVKGGTP